MSKADNRFDQLQGILNVAQEDMTKFYEKENKAAGTRVRKEMQNLKKLAQEIRLEIQDIKNKEL